MLNVHDVRDKMIKWWNVERDEEIYLFVTENSVSK